MTQFFRFANFELEPAARTLRQQGQALTLGSRAFDVLLALLERGGELVTKEQLLERAWPGLVVEEANIHVQVSRLRQLLGSEAIATVTGLGYRFALPLQQGAKETARHNLPAQRNAFVGREAALDEACARLRRTRLLTLIGIGGSGKTRLALRLAEQALPAYRDGVWWVDLATLDDAQQLAPAVAQAVGCKLQGAEPALGALAGFLRERALLVVLDNCEHLLDGVARLADTLLAAAQQVTLLATSREALGLADEAVLAVRPLALPAPEADGETIARAEAVRLFSDRAAQSAPGWALDAGNADVVAAICRRVDGIPLALELAAAQLGVVSPAQLLALLEERFHLLVGHRRALPRQQTLHAVIQWSYERLRPEQQALLMALAVCSGGCDLEGAAALMPPGTSPAALVSSLARLAEQSLLDVRHGEGRARYHLLETVRQFALDRLHDSGHAAELRNRHAAHCLAMAEAHADEIERHGEGAASIARLDLDRDNLLRALDWLGHHGGDAANALELRLVAALRHYWTSRGLMALGIKTTVDALERAEGRTPDRPHLLALTSATQLTQWAGQPDEGARHARRLLAAAETAGSAEFRAVAQMQLGVIAHHAGRLDEAESSLEAGRRIAQELDDPKLLADALSGLAAVATTRGRHDEALVHEEAVLAVRKLSGHGFRIAVALLNVGLSSFNLGDLPRARKHMLEAARLMQRVGSRRLDVHLLDMVAALAAKEAQWPTAVQLHAASAAQRRAAALALDDETTGQRDEELAFARAAIGSEAVDAGWLAGAALDADAALKLAAAYLGTTPPASP